MSAILLPDLPGQTTYTPRPRRFGVDQTPEGGGREDRLTRMGTRWSIDVKLPPMDYVLAMPLLAALADAEGQTVLLPWPQPGLVMRGRSGEVRVKGAGQTGKTLAVDGGGVGYPVRAGQFFSLKVDIGGGAFQRFLHQKDQTAARFDEAGEALLRFSPMLRLSPPDNTLVEIELPMIEGFLSLSGDPYDLGQIEDVGLGFTVSERE